MKIGKLSIEITWEGNYMTQVKNALRDGCVLQAVKIYKTATGKGLKESKEAVDALCPKYLKKLP